MEENETKTALNRVGWNFREICAAAKEIKPSAWIAVATKHRLSFMEVALGHSGPVTIEKQLILNHSMDLEGYICGQRVGSDALPTNFLIVRSAKDLKNRLKIFSSFESCLGNKNFKRVNNTDSAGVTEYWKHSECHQIFKKTVNRPESCCEACLQLNSFLPKKINNTYLSLSYPMNATICQNDSSIRMNNPGKVLSKRTKTDMKIKTKRIKQEIEEVNIEEKYIAIKEEPLF